MATTTLSGKDVLKLLVGPNRLPVYITYADIEKCDPDSYLYIQFTSKLHELQHSENEYEYVINPGCDPKGFIAVIEYIRYYYYPWQWAELRFPIDTINSTNVKNGNIPNCKIAEALTPTLRSMYFTQQLYDAFDYCGISISLDKLLTIGINVDDELFFRKILRDPECFPTTQHLYKAIGSKSYNITRLLLNANVPVDPYYIEVIMEEFETDLLTLVLKYTACPTIPIDLLHTLIECKEWKLLEIFLNNSLDLIVTDHEIVYQMTDFFQSYFEENYQQYDDIMNNNDIIENEQAGFDNIVLQHVKFYKPNECSRCDFLLKLELMFLSMSVGEASPYEFLRDERHDAIHTLRVIINHISKYVCLPCCLKKLKLFQDFYSQLQQD